jgi:predicted permease
VRGVGATNALPLTSNPWRNGLSKPNADPAAPSVSVNIRLVTPDYLEILRVPLARGRQLSRADNESAPGVAVINEVLARELYPGEDPIGKTLNVDSRVPRTIVGVVGGIHHTSLTAPADNEIYIPFRQAGARRSRVIAIRTDGPPDGLVAAVQREVRAVDPNLLVRSVRSLDDIVTSSVAPQRFRAAFIGSLAVLALVLAVVGVYGVTSYTVSERTREMGIRLALGESPARIRRRVLVEGLELAALGTAVGALGSWAATRALESVIFGVGRGDPWTLGTVALVLTVVTILAADGPARRAGRVDPISAIRGE